MLSPDNSACSPGLALLLVEHDLHADAAGLLLAPGHGKAELHVPLVLLQTLGQVRAALVQVGGVQRGLAAVVTRLPVDVGAAHTVPAHADM